MNFFVELFNNNPVLAIVLALIVIAALVSIVKGLIKVALTLAIIAVVAIVFFDVNPENLIKTGEQAAQTANAYYEKTIKPVIDKEIAGAKYSEKEDGTYIVKTESLSIEGKKGSETVIVNFKGKSVKIDVALLGDKFKELINSQNT